MPPKPALVGTSLPLSIPALFNHFKKAKFQIVTVVVFTNGVVALREVCKTWRNGKRRRVAKYLHFFTISQSLIG